MTNDGTYKYYYDCENKLTDVNTVADVYAAKYAYDYKGRRIQKITYDTNGQILTTINYIYDGDQIIAEYNGSGTLLRKYIYGPKIDEPIIMIDVSSGERYYYHYDGLGSVVALLNNSGNIVEQYRYDVFGTPTILSPSGEPRATSDFGNCRMFTGREYDSETGNYYYRARFYNPNIGRFLQTDPAGYIDSLNLYTYVMNNPVVLTDPMGDFAVVPIIIGGGASCGLCAHRIYHEYLGKFPPAGETPEDNFMRHCSSMCEVSKQCTGGKACALAVGWGYEIWRWPIDSGDKKDLSANKAGRAASGCGGSCGSACKKAFESKSSDKKDKCSSGPCG